MLSLQSGCGSALPNHTIDMVDVSSCGGNFVGFTFELLYISVELSAVYPVMCSDVKFINE